MPRSCYRCGQPVEEKVPFCPACGAPQIRVTTPSAEALEPSPIQEPSPEAPASGPAPAVAHGLQWGAFFQLASPLAALTGLLACLFFPLAIALVFPLCLRRILARYRAFHPGPLAPGQGAALGAFMALLSFAAFLIFVLPTVSVKHDAMVAMVREMASQNPDPQAQQMMLWLTTRPGFIVLTALTMLIFLGIFLVVGAISGAVMASPRRNRP